jgi:hypothetical protein
VQLCPRDRVSIPEGRHGRRFWLPPEVIALTSQEEQLLGSLVERVNQTELQEKDPDAETLLNKSLASNPDALYILAQTVLVQNIALEQAKAQVSQLQQAQQQRQPARATSFLGNLLGHRDPEPAALQTAPQQGYQPVSPQYNQPAPQYAQQPQYQQPQYQQPQYATVPAGQPSFLRGAAQTAAGVAAGALVFEGVESILHGLGGHPEYGWGGGGMGPGMMGGGFERPVEETVVNNYYDDPNAGGEHRGVEGGEHRFHESADQGGAQFNDASYNTSGDDRNNELSDNADDSGSYDDSNNDGGSGFDDSGSGGDGGGSGGDVL